MINHTLEDKIKLAEDEIKKQYQLNNGNIFVSFSGGKDSTVLRHIALSLYPNLNVVFSDTTNELHEVYQFVKKQNDVIWVKPTISFIDSVKKHGFPLVSKEVSHLVFQLKNTATPKTKQLRLDGNAHGVGKVPNKWKFLAEQSFDLNNKCCQRLKKDPLKKWAKENNMKPIIGIMSTESRLRNQLALFGKDDGNQIYPFLRTGWTEKDIWDYANKFNIRFAECYYDRVVNGFLLKGESRTGCEYCGFGIHLETNSRFTRSKLLTPKRYKKMMNLENGGVKFSEAIDIVMKKDLPMPVLGLYGYEIIKFEEEEYDIHIELKHLHDKKKCKHCNSSSIRKKGTRDQFYFDTPMCGKRVGLHVEVQGYLCNDCNKFSQAYLPFMSTTHSMTDRCVDYIQKQSLQHPFTHVANDVGVSEGIVRKMFKYHTAELATQYKFETPKVMGIDEIHLSGRARAVITNIGEKTIIEMFKDRSYSFETIRAKMLYSKSIHKTKKPKIQKKRPAQRSGYMEMSRYGTPPSRQKVEIKNYGADILKLVKLLENGDL